MKQNRIFYIMAAIVLSIIICAMLAKSQEKAKADTTISVSVEKITAQIAAKQWYIKAQRDTLAMIETMKKNVENDIMGVFYQIDALTKLKQEADTLTTKKGNKK